MRKFLIVLAICLFSASCSILTRVVCQSAATTECASGFKFTATGSNLNTKYCLPAGKSCTVGSFDNTVALYNCTIDYKNSNCSTGICYGTATDTSYCTPDFTNCNASVNIYSYDCSGCTSITNCPFCIHNFLDGNQTGAETCLGSTCGAISNLTTRVFPCQWDNFGIGCSCCVKTDESAKICTSTNPVLSMADVTAWAKVGGTNGTNNSNGNGNFEFNLKIIGVFTLLLIALMF